MTSNTKVQPLSPSGWECSSEVSPFVEVALQRLVTMYVYNTMRPQLFNMWKRELTRPWRKREFNTPAESFDLLQIIKSLHLGDATDEKTQTLAWKDYKVFFELRNCMETGVEESYNRSDNCDLFSLTLEED